MKSIMISIQPKWCKLISEGKKTVEVRKTKPKLDVPFKCYIYMTRGNPTFEQSAFSAEISNGKVIGEFVCDKIIQLDEYFFESADCMKIYEEYKQTCLSCKEITEYAKGKEILYGWHISSLVIYDKPKELSEFKHECDGNCLDTKVKKKCDKFSDSLSVSVDRFECDRLLPFKRPPQSWCYVEELGV